MDSNLLDKIARSRKLMTKLYDLGKENDFDKVDVALEEFNEIFKSTDHFEVIENYVKSISNAIIDFESGDDENRFLKQITILEEIYNSLKGVLLAEVYSNSLNGIIKYYSESGKYKEASKFLKKYEYVYDEFQEHHFVVNYYGVSIYNVLVARGKEENIEVIESYLDLLLDLNKKHPTGMFNPFVVDAIGYCIAYFGLSSKLERFPELNNICQRLYGNRRKTDGSSMFDQTSSLKEQLSSLVDQAFNAASQQVMYDSGYIRTLYNTSKYYGIKGNIKKMEESLDRLIEFFKLPTPLFTHNIAAGEPLGVAFRNACSVYAREDMYEKLKNTINSFEKLYKKYSNPNFNFEGELTNVTEIAQNYFNKIGDQKTAKQYYKRLAKYLKIIETRKLKPYRAGASTRNQCKSCNAKWVSGPVDYEFENTKEVFASEKGRRCPYCGKEETEAQFDIRYGVGISS